LKPHVNNMARWLVAKRLFDTEADVLYELGHHDQIPSLLAHFEEDQEFYLVQELIEGQSLNDKLVPGQPWPEKRVIVLLQDILRVLAYVHQQNVIHRDIKPSNIICRRKDGRAVLIDFGAVKQVSNSLIDSKLGQSMTISIGTQGYTPTEQLGGNPRFNSDIYAVGMLGIQALTGIRPHLFERDPQTGEIVWRPDELAARQAEGSRRAEDAPQNLETVQICPELAEILDRMVRYHFRDRYPTVMEPLEALEALLSQRTDIVPADELALLAEEASLAWEVEHPNTSQRSPNSTVPASGVGAAAIAPTAFSTADSDITSAIPEMATELENPNFDEAAEPSRLQTVLSQLRSVVLAPGVRFTDRPQSWKIWGLGGIGLVAVVGAVGLWAGFNKPPAAEIPIAPVPPSATAIAIPALPCKEPSPPALPSRAPDYEYPDGTRYYGPLSGGQPTDGRATLLFPTGNRYDGEIRSGKRNGCGTYSFDNGKRYVGQFKDDNFEGKGIWMFGTGDRYVGEFKANRCHGEGIFIFADDSQKRGMWQDGKLVGGDLSCNR
jgi:serine/threonine protein kinase